MDTPARPVPCAVNRFPHRPGPFPTGRPWNPSTAHGKRSPVPRRHRPVSSASAHRSGDVSDGPGRLGCGPIRKVILPMPPTTAPPGSAASLRIGAPQPRLNFSPPDFLVPIDQRAAIRHQQSVADRTLTRLWRHFDPPQNITTTPRIAVCANGFWPAWARHMLYDLRNLTITLPAAGTLGLDLEDEQHHNDVGVTARALAALIVRAAVELWEVAEHPAGHAVVEACPDDEARPTWHAARRMAHRALLGPPAPPVRDEIGWPLGAGASVCGLLDAIAASIAACLAPPARYARNANGTASLIVYRRDDAPALPRKPSTEDPQ